MAFMLSNAAGFVGMNMTLGKRYEGLTLRVTLEEAQRNDVRVHARVSKKKVTRCDGHKT